MNEKEYDNGEGLEQDFKEAVKRYQKAADQGDAEAQMNLGGMYENGQGVEQDDKEAFKWYQKAFKWYQKAADQGDAEAQMNLGLMYENGEGVEQDDKEAVKWYQKAADQGDALAQYILDSQSNLDGGFDPGAPMGGPGKLGLILIGFLLLVGGIPIILVWIGC
ncbi:MAG: sel1 repeat family protein [Verrucomicrobiales bacterium]|nr:sel1 repeat family protein [Verrucomicrobiales bacterium]